jgi:hypothetical protein
MTTRKILGRISGGRARRLGSGPARLRILLPLLAATPAVAALAACSSAGAALRHRPRRQLLIELRRRRLLSRAAPDRGSQRDDGTD